jgi:hypothetical protein
MVGAVFKLTRSVEWALNQCNWYPLKKEIYTDTHGEEDVKTQGEDGCQQAKDRYHRRNQLC